MMKGEAVMGMRKKGQDNGRNKRSFKLRFDPRTSGQAGIFPARSSMRALSSPQPARRPA